MRRLSSEEDIDPMVQLYRGLHQEYPLRLLHIVATIRTTMQGDDATTIDAIVVVVETARVVARSTSIEVWVILVMAILT